MDKKLIGLLTIVGVLIVFFLSYMVLYDGQEKVPEQSYVFKLSGESANWEINGYEIAITNDYERTGGGELLYKGDQPLSTDFYSLNVVMVLNGVEETLHYTSSSGMLPPFSNTELGLSKSEGEGLVHFGKLRSLEDIDEIYAIIKWGDASEMYEERISLY